MTLSYWQQDAIPAPTEVDVAVIGGGVVGVSTAYWLARQDPSARIALVERDTLANAASGRNAGFLLQGSSCDYATATHRYGRRQALRLWRFTEENRNLIGAEFSSAEIQLHATGSLVVAGSEQEDERLRAARELMRSDGIPVIYLSEEEIRRRLDAEAFNGALYVPSGATCNPLRLVRTMAEKSGALIFEHRAAHEIRSEDDRVVVETSQGALHARRVVVALNAYAPQLLPETTEYVEPLRAQMFATEPAARVRFSEPAYTHDGYYYVRQQADGRVLVGGARHLHVEEEVGYEDRVTEPVQADLSRYVETYFPAFARLDVEQRWSGTMGFSPDGLPCVGTLERDERVLWAAGFSGHGMGYGFRMGQLLAECASGEEQPPYLDLFTAARFE